jgi:hypothetical protein
LFELNSKVLLHSFIPVWCRLFCFWLKVSGGFEKVAVSWNFSF